MDLEHLSTKTLAMLGLFLVLGFGFVSYIGYGSVVDKIVSNDEYTYENDGVDLSAAVMRSMRSGDMSPDRKYKTGSSTPQFVLFSFDGSRSLAVIKEIGDFATDMKKQGKPIRFTFFANAAHFINDTSAPIYTGPNQVAGKSDVGFGGSASDVNRRVVLFNAMVKEGHEIASHSVGHFLGQNWSFSEWKGEFTAFDKVMDSIVKNNFPFATDEPVFSSRTIVGFRAPSLEVNDNLYSVLGHSRFRYDSSGIGNSSNWPHKNSYGTWEIPLPIITLASNGMPVLSMDYNFWQVQSGGSETATKGSYLWNKYFEDVLESYKIYFKKNYSTSRAPVMISNHVKKWNDGVYMEALKAFAKEVCGMPDVVCSTYTELVDYLDANGAPQIIGKR